jgi:hypothetical protein
MARQEQINKKVKIRGELAGMAIQAVGPILVSQNYFPYEDLQAVKELLESRGYEVVEVSELT